MSRAGITYEEAKAAYDKIVAAGEKPTAERLRKELGRGSMTTINALLQAIKREMDSAKTLESLVAISPAVAEAVINVHKELQAVARTQIEQAQDRCDQQLREVEGQRAELQARLDAALEQISRQEQEIQIARSMFDAERENLVKAREQIAALSSQAAGQAEIIDDLKSRLQASQDEARRAVAQREHYQTAVAEERNRERVEHASVLSHQKAQNDSLSKELVARIEQLSQANIRIAALELEASATKAGNAELKSAQARLIEQLDSREATIATLRQNLDLAVAQERELRNEVAGTKADLAEARQRIAIAEVKLSHAEAENSTLNEKVRTAEVLLEDLRKSKGDQVS